MFTTAAYLGHMYSRRNEEVEKVSLFPEFFNLSFDTSIKILRCFCRTQVLKHTPFICVDVTDCVDESQLIDKLYFTAEVSLRAGHRANWLAVKMVLPAWFDHLDVEESFCYKEVQFKKFFPPVKTGYPPTENFTKTPGLNTPWKNTVGRGSQPGKNQSQYPYCSCLMPQRPMLRSSSHKACEDLPIGLWL